MAHRKGPRILAAVGALGLGLLVSLSGASSALADGPVTLTFASPTSQSIEYGQYWEFPSKLENAYSPIFGSANAVASGTITGVPSGYQAVYFVYPSGQDDGVFLSGVSESGQPFLPVGSYSITETVTDGVTSATTATPAQLTITPAKLGVTVRIVPDAQNPRNAVVAALLTGKLVDSAGGEGGPDLNSLLTAGTWKVHIVDSTGATAQDFTADRAAGGYTTAASFSWPDVAAGDYTATATFAPSGAGASNFSVAGSGPTAFAAPGVAPEDASTAPPAPSEEPPAADTGPTVPAWVLVAVGVLTAGLIALVIVQIVQLSRTRGTPHHGEVNAL